MLKKISDFKYSIEKSGDMLVPGIIYGKDKTIADAGDETIAQVEAAACLPGIESCSIAMPDMHLGYGFPIGGVAAFDIKAGVIAPGAVGYDINCGVRLISTGVLFEEARGRLEALADALYNAVPTGIGAEGDIDLRHKDFLGVIKRGAAWAVESGFGSEDDISRTEDLGVMRFDGDDSVISTDAFERGKRQLGTLGSGNHFLEVQELTEIFDTAAADAYGLFKGQLCVMFHSGSRGFGYRVCDDYLREFSASASSYKAHGIITAHICSSAGKKYLAAMAAAANYGWANRQVIAFRIKECIEKTFRAGAASLGINTVYDISHNLARQEVSPEGKSLIVVRKGATRAFPAGHEMNPDSYMETGHPVLLPGDMGRRSYVMKAGINSKDAFYSCAHGAGRKFSRSAALKKAKGRDIISELREDGVIVRAKSRKYLAEEAPFAYKDVDDVIEGLEGAGLAVKVASLRPAAVVKG